MSALHYRLVPASADDRPWLEELRRAVYQDLFMAVWGSWDEEGHTRQFTACWQRGHIAVIEVEHRRVGMIQLLEIGDAIEIAEIQVQPSHQGRGIGTGVLMDVMARGHAERKRLVLRTSVENHRAIALYERLGFQHVSRSDTHVHMEFVPVR